MITNSSIEIDASPSTVWDVFTDVERWSSWTESITRIVALDGPGIEVARRFEIKQPRMPKLVWEVTSVVPGVAFTWRQRSLGATTLAVHELEPLDGGRTRVRQEIDQRGPIGVVVGRLTSAMTRRYLAIESDGLKARSEQIQRNSSSR